MCTRDIKTHCSHIFPRQGVEELMLEDCRQGIQQSFLGLCKGIMKNLKIACQQEVVGS